MHAKAPVAFVRFAKPYNLHPTPYSLQRDPLHPTPARRREHLSNLRRSGRHDRFRVLSVCVYKGGGGGINRYSVSIQHLCFRV